MMKEEKQKKKEAEVLSCDQIKLESDGALKLLEAYIHGNIQDLAPPATNPLIYRKCAESLNLLRKNFLILLKQANPDSSTVQSGETGNNQVDTDGEMSKTPDDEDTQTGNDYPGAGSPAPGNEAPEEAVQG